MAPASAALPQAPLMPFDATGRTPWAVPFGWHDYADLVDWTGRLVRPGKKGCIEAAQPAILGARVTRVALAPDTCGAWRLDLPRLLAGAEI